MSCAKYLIILVLLLILPAAAANAQSCTPRTNNSTVSTCFPVTITGQTAGSGPCNVGTSCAEAWAVTSRVVDSYSGPFFQIAPYATPSTTMDVGQTAGHTADLTGVLSFCGGTYANCGITKIYAQVQGHGNDLVPPVVPLGCPDIITCAGPLTIDGNSGLPVLPLGATPSHYGLYAIANDGVGVGITSGSAASNSVILVGQSVVMTNPYQCCGAFNLAHSRREANISGTDLGVNLMYGNGGSYVNCGASNVFCLAPDLEGNHQPHGNSLGSSPLYGELFLSWDSNTNQLVGAVNNQQSWTPQPPRETMNPGSYIHLGGGGDFSSAEFNAFEWYVFNSALTGPQQTAIFNNVVQRYPTVQFPVGGGG